jgi:hypothetical protein
MMEHDMPDGDSRRGEIALRWGSLGVAGGLAACVAYPLTALAPLPRLAAVALAALFGPALAVASVGLFYVLGLSRESVASQLGAVFNLLPSALVSAMFLY